MFTVQSVCSLPGKKQRDVVTAGGRSLAFSNTLGAFVEKAGHSAVITMLTQFGAAAATCTTWADCTWLQEYTHWLLRVQYLRYAIFVRLY